jgi:hypothetical protein
MSKVCLRVSRLASVVEHSKTSRFKLKHQRPVQDGPGSCDLELIVQEKSPFYIKAGSYVSTVGEGGLVIART